MDNPNSHRGPSADASDDITQGYSPPPASTPSAGSRPSGPPTSPHVPREPAGPPPGLTWVSPDAPPVPPAEPAAVAGPDDEFEAERQAAASRLRNVTMGVAAVGLVAVGGFAVLAANGFTGVDTAATGTSSSNGGTTNPGLVPGDNAQPGASSGPDDQGVFGQPPSSDGNGFFQPNNNGFFQQNGGGFQSNGNSINPPSTGFGPGHASSGGS